MDGRVATITAIVQREGLTRRYVMRLVRLSFLALDIIEAILQGQQPAHFTLEPIRCPMPVDWVAQRRYFGFLAVPSNGTVETVPTQ